MFGIFRRPGIGRRIMIGFAISFALIVGCILVAERVYDTQAQVRHTEQIESVLRILLIDLLDSETGQRGFLLTGEPSYLDPYHTGSLNSTIDLARLNVLCQSPGEIDFFTALQPVVEHKLAELQETVRLYPVNREQAIAIVASGVGRDDMVLIRAMFWRRERDSFTAKVQQNNLLHWYSLWLVGMIVLAGGSLWKLSELGSRLAGP